MNADQNGFIIRNNEQFRTNFHRLNSTSIICCRLRIAPGEEHMLLDLLQRQVKLMPSPSAQLASRSKVYQAVIFREMMLPHTEPIYDTNSLLETTSRYRQLGVGQVVVKRDRKNGGLGVHRYQDIEDVYNHACCGSLAYPFVVQPFLEKFEDIRLIRLGEYSEAYRRLNPYNFRHNLHCGGTASPLEPDDQLLDFCNRVMERGHFPYAHIDLMRTEKALFLTEINLRGGLRGARIDGMEYKQRIAAIHREWCAGHEQQETNTD